MNPVSAFGRDHASLLAHIEYICVNSAGKGHGEIDSAKLRCNPETHPHKSRTHRGGTRGWEDAHGTRLKDGSVLPKHDDWDCIEDMEAAGLVDLLSYANGLIKLTEKGSATVARINKHKAGGGSFSDFEWGTL